MECHNITALYARLEKLVVVGKAGSFHDHLPVMYTSLGQFHPTYMLLYHTALMNQEG